MWVVDKRLPAFGFKGQIFAAACKLLTFPVKHLHSSQFGWFISFCGAKIWATLSEKIHMQMKNKHTLSPWFMTSRRISLHIVRTNSPKSKAPRFWSTVNRRLELTMYTTSSFNCQSEIWFSFRPKKTCFWHGNISFIWRRRLRRTGSKIMVANNTRRKW